MFREMRRNKQELSQAACEAVLERNTAAVLAVNGDEGYPYAVPLSYFFDGERIIIHCAKSGYKLDAIVRDGKVSLCVIDADDIVPEEYTTYYRSVIIFGHARVVDDDEERRRVLSYFAAKYTPDDPDGCAREVDKTLARVCMVEISIDYMTGKEAKELVKAR